MVTKQQVIDVLLAHGYEKDKFGHYQKTTHNGSENKTYRYKLSGVLARKEVQAKIGGKNEWLRVSSQYYGKLTIGTSNPGGKPILQGMSRLYV